MRKLNLLFLFLSAIITAINNNATYYVDWTIGGFAPFITTRNLTVRRPHSIIKVFPDTKHCLVDRCLSIYGFAFSMPPFRNSRVTELMPAKGAISVSLNANPQHTIMTWKKYIPINTR